MNDQKLYSKLVGYIQDCHAMEQNILRMLDSMIATTKDAETIQRLKEHYQQTQHHEQLLRNRLTALGEGRSFISETAAAVGAIVKGVNDSMRSDKAGRNARDAFITEQAEIASYDLLERLAERAGDMETANMAREIRRDEEAMAQWIADRWDKFVDLTLEEEGITPTIPVENSDDFEIEGLDPSTSSPSALSSKAASRIVAVDATAASNEAAIHIEPKPITLAAPPTHELDHRGKSHRSKRSPSRTKTSATQRRRSSAAK